MGVVSPKARPAQRSHHSPKKCKLLTPSCQHGSTMKSAALLIYHYSERKTCGFCIWISYSKKWILLIMSSMDKDVSDIIWVFISMYSSSCLPFLVGLLFYITTDMKMHCTLLTEIRTPCDPHSKPFISQWFCFKCSIGRIYMYLSSRICLGLYNISVTGNSKFNGLIVVVPESMTHWHVN